MWTAPWCRRKDQRSRSSSFDAVDGILQSLPPQASGLAVLAGAGISIDAPSNLLSGWHFMDAVLHRVMPPEVPADVAQSLISVPTTGRFRPGEFVRFESLMMSLRQAGIDPDLRVLDCLDACEHPNANHYVLAELIRRGAIVMTTNFDRLIEIAYARLTGSAPLSVVYEDSAFPPEGAPPGGSPALWKLHGTLSVDGRPARDSVQATILAIMWPGLTRRKQAFVRSVLAARDLVVIGYSGSDDLDLVPLLAETPTTRAMAWIDHAAAGAAVTARTAADVNAALEALTQYEVVGRNRVFFTRGLPEGSPSADPDRVVLISAPTGPVMSRLQQRYCPDLSVPAAAEQYEFGLQHAAAVAGYFDRWLAASRPTAAARYRFATDLLTNRRVRDDVAPLYDELKRRHLALIARPGASAAEQLDYLMHRFNTRGTAADAGEVERGVFDALQALIPRLSDPLAGTAYRLSACTLWNQGRREDGEALFRRAWESGRQAGDPGEELATLTTWQRATNSTRDHLSYDDHRRANDVARMLGQPLFPDDAFLRLQELAEQTGYKLNLFRHLLSAQEIGFVEEDPQRKALLLAEARAAVRVSVDLGDVAGEAQARLLLALCLQDRDEYEEAAQHALCIIALGDVCDLGETGLRARALLAQMPTDDFVRRYRSALSDSLWVRS